MSKIFSRADFSDSRTDCSFFCSAELQIHPGMNISRMQIVSRCLDLNHGPPFNAGIPFVPEYLEKKGRKRSTSEGRDQRFLDRYDKGWVKKIKQKMREGKN
ncbi:hypothetical protein AVEN_181828-1 [Araneus ventricosus]|uniref:Uncharacterized protein n=1 Tax=Araneus ventricosus TaxID=182803 RepID=A0A4Y2EWD5_ARAVE|nr:hypothetical protein AVEN_181828-1 [Araneus ventricosus]